MAQPEKKGGERSRIESGKEAWVYCTLPDLALLEVVTEIRYGTR